MKTTIELPDALFQKTKMLAAERRTTLKSIVIEALQQWVRTPPEDEEKKRKAKMKVLIKAMQASNTQAMVPLRREQIYDRS